MATRRRAVCIARTLAEADAFGPALGLARREALWAIKALRDEPAAEIDEPEVALKPMTAGSEVVEDYSHVGLTLRRHPVAFLRADLQARRIVTCEDAMQARDGRWLEAAGLVLVRQRPGSAKGVLFITLEDETGIANLVVWPQTFEKFRGVVMGPACLPYAGGFSARARWSTWLRTNSPIFQPTSPPSAAATRRVRCPMAAAIRSREAAGLTRASCRPRACGSATSIRLTCTSTRSK